MSAEVVFIYTVEFGDITSGAVLEVDTRFAIRDGDALFLDLLGREANVTLPELDSDATLSATAAVSIDSAEPVVVAVGSSLAGGEYGVGQVNEKPRAHLTDDAKFNERLGILYIAKIKK